ncbi:MAG: hypothetical protein ABJC04_13170, partial [Verrucomicrobiota bacterium]
MKTLIAIVLAASTGFAAAYFFVSGQNEMALKNERAKVEAQWQTDKQKLERELANARNKKDKGEEITKEVTVVSHRSAKEILDNLLTLQPTGANRIQVIRKIVHELEDLASLGNEAVPDIRAFLARNADLEYSISSNDRENGGRGGFQPPWQRSTPSTEFTLPPSLRIGLFDVLKDIGTDEARTVMGEVLGNSGRAVEVAYLARSLEEIAPGKYREVALSAAKDLLRNPITVDHPNRLDEQAEGYLYGVLELYNDASFIEEAKKMLVNAEGRLDRNAQQYLSKLQGDAMVATYYEMYNQNTLTNTFDRISVANQILGHVGPNQQANQFLKEVVQNTNLDSRMRSFAILQLAGGFGGTETPSDPNLIRQQLPILENLKTATADERILQAIDRTQQNLQNVLEGKPVENQFNRFRGGGNDGNAQNDG